MGNTINIGMDNNGNITIDYNEFNSAVNTIVEKKISELEKKTRKKERKKPKCCFWKRIKSFICSYWFLTGVIIVLLGAILFCHIYKITNSNNTTIVLAFVGILATFVVISNYAQTKEVKDDVKEQNKKIEYLLNDIEKKYAKIFADIYYLIAHNHNVIRFRFWHYYILSLKYLKESDDIKKCNIEINKMIVLFANLKHVYNSEKTQLIKDIYSINKNNEIENFNKLEELILNLNITDEELPVDMIGV